MRDNYAKIVQNNLKKLYENLPEDLERLLPGDRQGDGFVFEAFGERCEVRPDGIFLGEALESGVLGILISLYVLHAGPETCILEPLKAFKDFPNSMPYAGAFVTHTQQILVPHAERITEKKDRIMARLKGQAAPSSTGGDVSFLVYPLPKIALCYIIYDADEDFPASVTCLYSSNALSFMPIDGIADVGEYTSKKILELL
ncbi:DUF3786 domain-containing protein [Thermodesulfobacteriota bacterium]